MARHLVRRAGRWDSSPMCRRCRSWRGVSKRNTRRRSHVEAGVDMGVLAGVRVIEIAGIGPAPFCGMLLADMGADVILIERPGGNSAGPTELGEHAIVN